MNPTLSVTKMHLRAKLNWFYLPFAILLFSFIINLVIGKMVSSGGDLKTGGIASIYVYILVMGMMIIRDTFSFSISFSVRRTDYFVGTLLNIVIVSGISALLLNILTILEQSTNQWGIQLYFFNIPYLNDGAIWQQWFIAFSLFLHLFYSGFVSASITRRFGKLGLVTLLGIVLIVPSIFSLFATQYGWWGSIFEWFLQHTAFEIAFWLIPLTLVYIALSYLLLRRTTV